MSAPAPQDVDWGAVRLPGLADGCTALVTGGTGAIGWRTATAFAAMGVRVGVMGRSPERVEGAVAAAGPIRDRLVAIPGDVARPEDADRAVTTLLDRWGRLDVLVHAAAVGDSGSTLADLTVAEIDELLAVNVKGTLLMAQRAAAPMRSQGGGRMVLLASVAAFRAGPRGNVYGATKAAVVRLARQLAVELGPDGIVVNAMSPGQTPSILRSVGDQPGQPARPSRGGNEDDIPLRRRGHPDDYVGAIAFLASDLARYVAGVDVLVDGGVAVRR